MSSKRKADDDVELGLGDNPLDERDPLVTTFYRAPEPARGRTRRGKGRQPLKEGRSWRLVTFSFYEEDVRRLDALLAEAKKRGHKRVSRSQIVRLALRQVDLAALPELI
ncbi:MAG: hypothetical protein IT382_06600 [Deltaproteobacteria bacterium]|nr:hypothetical protein [Deltaproteobacteria bacterium]